MRALFLFFSEGVKTVAVLFLFACGFFLSGCSSSTPKSEIGIYLADEFSAYDVISTQNKLNFILRDI